MVEKIAMGKISKFLNENSLLNQIWIMDPKKKVSDILEEMSSEFNEKNYSSKMEKSILSFKKDIATLRTGRANTNMLDTIKVDVYGQLMPIEQLGTISVPEARLISIQVWDKSNTNLIESAKQKNAEKN